MSDGLFFSIGWIASHETRIRDGALMNRCHDSQAMPASAQRAVIGLSLMASSARSLAELREIDRLVTCALFEPLCNGGFPMPLVSALVWPAVVALDQQASVLQIPWKPTLCRGDWEASVESPDSSGPLRAVSTESRSAM